MATTCVCGFTELADEVLVDHLSLMFTPDDSTGNDGVVHEELDTRACSCGFSGTSDEIGAHMLAAFTPANGIGHDGKAHGARDDG